MLHGRGCMCIGLFLQRLVWILLWLLGKTIVCTHSAAVSTGWSGYEKEDGPPGGRPSSEDFQETRNAVRLRA